IEYRQMYRVRGSSSGAIMFNIHGSPFENANW
ncbi:hypothetical protein F442_02127, partial [Phytophthora nicotianae P10297]